jgi:hypothetical protein
LTAAVSAAADSVFAVDDNEISIVVNGKTVEFDEQPFILNDCTMVPYNTISDALGVNIVWDKENQNAKVYYQNKDVLICTMERYSDYAELADGERTELEVSPTVVEGRAYVPIRALCDILGYSITWDGDNRSVKIDSELLEYYEEEFNAENDTSFSMLDDRIRIKLPSDVKSETDSSGKEHLLFSRGDSYAEMSLSDTYIMSVGDLAQDAENLGYEITGNKIITDDGVEIIPITGNGLNTDRIELSKYYVSKYYLIRNTDDYLLMLTVNIGTDTVHNRDMAEQWLSLLPNGVSGGLLKINTSAQSYEINGLTISLPEGYTAYSEISSDSTQWNIIKPTTSDKYMSKACIWLCAHNCASAYTEKSEKNTFLGLPIIWYSSDDVGEDGAYYTFTQLACIDNVEFTIEIYADNAEERDVLTQVCEDIKGDPYALSALYEEK